MDSEDQQLLEALRAAAPVGLGFVDRECRWVRINETLAELSDLPVEQHLGRTVADVAPTLGPALESACRRVLETGAQVTNHEIVRENGAGPGEVRAWLAGFHPVRAGGEVTGVAILAVDVSERRQSEEALRASKEFADQLIETSNAIVLGLDPEGKVVTFNRAAEEITGYTRQELEGLDWDKLVPRDRYPDVWEAFDRLIGEGRPARYENTIVTKSGEERVILWQNSRLIEDGRFAGTVSFGIDVTESVAAKQEVERSFELLRAGNEERRRLLAALVHAQEEERRRIAVGIHDDSVQVLTALALRLELLAAGIEDPAVVAELAEASQTVRSTIVNLRRLLFELHPPILDRGGLAEALEIELEQIGREAGIEGLVESELAEAPPPETSVIAYRIAQEALVNVRKHAAARHIWIHLSESAEGLRVRIRDDGSGFEPRPAEPGHLGVVSMRERAQMAGGWLRIESTPEQGTTVEFLLPPPT